MAAIRLSIARSLRLQVWDSLLRQDTDRESVGFLYASQYEEQGYSVFEGREWYPVPGDGYSTRTDRYCELKDAVRSEVIKRAHNSGLALVEFHSHLGPAPAAFSYSDHLGFQDFVPYVRWRLKGRPYLAVVVAHAGFDGLVWLGDSKHPYRLDGIREDGEFLRATGLSHRNLEDYSDWQV